MKKILSLMALTLLAACGSREGGNDDLDITSKFNGTWNIYEEIVKNGDGSITYYALPWGGLVGEVKERNMPVDWTKYEGIKFEFAEPTKVATQIMVSDKLKTWGKPGITSLTCYFDGQNVHNVDEVALQASDTTTLKISKISLQPGGSTWEKTLVWKGDCHFGNWENGFVIKPEKFTTAHEGDKLEIVFTTDKSNRDVHYWMLKTIINETEQTLEGNSNELNEWGCATMGKGATSYRIMLTANDIDRLRDKGAFINGYYNNVTQCNLLRRGIGTTDNINQQE
jgi:hypothetical protein